MILFSGNRIQDGTLVDTSEESTGHAKYRCHRRDRMLWPYYFWAVKVRFLEFEWSSMAPLSNHRQRRHLATTIHRDSETSRQPTKHLHALYFLLIRSMPAVRINCIISLNN